jgi:hypothetical protein
MIKSAAARQIRLARPLPLDRRVTFDPPPTENGMSAKERFILAATMSSVMVAMVTLVATWLNLGLRQDFVLQWAKAYIIAWPIAALTGFVIMPVARRLTTRILILMGGVA